MKDPSSGNRKMLYISAESVEMSNDILRNTPRVPPPPPDPIIRLTLEEFVALVGLEAAEAEFRSQERQYRKAG